MLQAVYLDRSPGLHQEHKTICSTTRRSGPDSPSSSSGDMIDNPREKSGGAVLRPSEMVAKEFDSSRPKSRRPSVTYHVVGVDDGLVPRSSWSKMEGLQPTVSAFFRLVVLCSNAGCSELVWWCWCFGFFVGCVLPHACAGC